MSAERDGRSAAKWATCSNARAARLGCKLVTSGPVSGTLPDPLALDQLRRRDLRDADAVVVSSARLVVATTCSDGDIDTHVVPEGEGKGRAGLRSQLRTAAAVFLV